MKCEYLYFILPLLACSGITCGRVAQWRALCTKVSDINLKLISEIVVYLYFLICLSIRYWMQYTPSICFQMMTDITEVSAEIIDLTNYVADYELCRQCPRPSDCSTQLPADHQYCPYLLFYGFNHVIGYVMVKCSTVVNLQIVTCFSNYTESIIFLENTPDKSLATSITVSVIHEPNPENIDKDDLQATISNFSKALTVIRIQQSDYGCPPYWHQMKNMCFALPHLIYKNDNHLIYKNIEGDLLSLPCSCGAVGSHRHHINHAKVSSFWYKVGIHVTENDLVLERYLKVLSETYKFGLLIDAIGYHPRVKNRVRLPLLGNHRKIHVLVGNDHFCDDKELCSMNISRQEISCPHGFFVCNDRTCLVETSRCDGQVDCVSGDDEAGCSEICFRPHPTKMCTQCTIAEGCQCNTFYFQCSGGGCVSATTVCDGVLSCADSSDEALCEPQYQQMSCEVDLKPYCPMSEQTEVFKQDVFIPKLIHTEVMAAIWCVAWIGSVHQCTNVKLHIVFQSITSVTEYAIVQAVMMNMVALGTQVISCCHVLEW